MAESRWADEFNRHPFRPGWTALKTALASAEVDDQTVPTSVYELARLKRVVAYLDEIISAVDPDMTPRSVWTTFQSQSDACLNQVLSFNSNKNIGHIAQANDHADNLLTYLKPYSVLPLEYLDAVNTSTRAYGSQVEGYIESFREKSAEILNQLQAARTEMISDAATTRKNKSRVEAFTRELFDGTEKLPSIQKAIGDVLVAATAQAAQIKEFHTSLVIGTPQAQSTQAKVAAAAVEITASQEKVAKLLQSADEQLGELDAFHDKIFGLKDPASGRIVGGLKAEIDARTEQLGILEHVQQTKYTALLERIESLLPGATSAGLASSYKTLKDGFTKPIQLYTSLFYGSLSALVLAAIVMAVDRVDFSPIFAIKLVETPQWDSILRALLYKAPFVAPVIWLALFATTRRSQYERLQQEYAHKEALASSFESYKKQLQELKDDSEGLQRELIGTAIGAIAFNASATLDGKHEDKLPSHEFLSRLAPDELRKLVEKLADAIAKAKSA